MKKTIIFYAFLYLRIGAACNAHIIFNYFLIRQTIQTVLKNKKCRLLLNFLYMLI